jgi:hypothetical protein
MKIKSQQDFWAGLMFIATGIGFAWGATFYNFGSSARPGPGYFPFGLGILLALLGAFTLFEALTIAAMAGDEFHWGEVLANAVILTAGSWVIFIWGLKLVIPLWPKFITG